MACRRLQSFGPKAQSRGLATALAGMALTTLLLSSGAALAQEKVLRVAMTAADIPKTNGQPDQGFEGNRFTGIPLFDALTQWDLSSADKPSVLIPGLATEWAVDANDKTKWIFKLRQGVKFHDGSDLTADAVVWNVDKVLKQGRRPLRPRPDRRHRQPHADPGLGPQGRRLHGGADHQGAGQLPAHQPLQPVHGLADALAEEVRRAGERRPTRPSEPSRHGPPSPPTPPAPARSG